MDGIMLTVRALFLLNLDTLLCLHICHAWGKLFGADLFEALNNAIHQASNIFYHRNSIHY